MLYEVHTPHQYGTHLTLTSADSVDHTAIPEMDLVDATSLT